MATAGKLGILTFHKCINYGSYWQARCLAEGLAMRGHEVELLDHGCKCVWRAEARCALQPTLPHRTPLAELKQYARKTRRFARSIAKLPMSRPFSLHEPRRAGEYDSIIVGSDEVWNFCHPWYGSKPIFFGDGLQTRRLVSYAASFGNHPSSDGIGAPWASLLDRFSAISVRDQNSWELVNSSIARDAELVLDPCLQFEKTIPREARREVAPYVLVYGHGFPSWLERSARRWARGRGLKLLSVGYSNTFADEQKIAADPDEFAQLMAGAKAVITNFFHGCIFALLNKKPWITAPSEYRSIKIPDLAAAVGARHRLVSDSTPDHRLAELLETPVEPEVEAKIEQSRERSARYLDEALY